MKIDLKCTMRMEKQYQHSIHEELQVLETDQEDNPCKTEISKLREREVTFDQLLGQPIVMYTILLAVCAGLYCSGRLRDVLHVTSGICVALRIAMIHERQVNLDVFVPKDNEVWCYGCYRSTKDFKVPVDAIPESAMFVLNESPPMSREWTVFMAKLGYLTKSEIDALGIFDEQCNWLIDDANLYPVPPTMTSSAEPFTNQAVVAGMEQNICVQPFAYFALPDRCHPAVKTYLCHHVSCATCLQA